MCIRDRSIAICGQRRESKIRRLVIEAAILKPQPNRAAEQRIVDACAKVCARTRLPANVLAPVQRGRKEHRADPGNGKRPNAQRLRAVHVVRTAESMQVVLVRERLSRVELAKTRVVISCFVAQPPMEAVPKARFSAERFAGGIGDACLLYTSRCV